MGPRCPSADGFGPFADARAVRLLTGPIVRVYHPGHRAVPVMVGWIAQKQRARSLTSWAAKCSHVPVG